MNAVNRPIAARSRHWPALRAAYLATHPLCAACGSTIMLEVHHIKPYHLFPTLELDPENLLTLCEGVCNCHLCFGHLHNWSAYNPNVVEDVAAYYAKVLHRAAA